MEINHSEMVRTRLNRKEPLEALVCLYASIHGYPGNFHRFLKYSILFILALIIQYVGKISVTFYMIGCRVAVAISRKSGGYIPIPIISSMSVSAAIEVSGLTLTGSWLAGSLQNVTRMTER